MSELIAEAALVLEAELQVFALPLALSSRLRGVARRILRQTPVRWGSLRRTAPLSDFFGYERGQPIDRFYIERFLARFQADIRGRTLEVRDARYTQAYGHDRVTSVEILDIDPGNGLATLVADLGDPASLPEGHYDCLVVTQTLQYVSDPQAALENMWRSLAPGGAALLSVPCVTRVDPKDPSIDRWRFTPVGLESLLRRSCSGADIDVYGFGNVLAGVAFLMGIAADELDEKELEELSEAFPIVVCARVRKSA